MRAQSSLDHSSLCAGVKTTEQCLKLTGNLAVLTIPRHNGHFN